MYTGLKDYMARLAQQGELLEVRQRVDPVLEIAEITDRISKTAGGGKALLFTDTGTEFPVLTNMLGSQRRMAMALGADDMDQVRRRVGQLISAAMAPRHTLRDKLKMLPLVKEIRACMPRRTSGRGPCQQVIHMGKEADLGMLPVLKCWPADGGRFVTLPMVHTVDPVTGAANVGMYRMQITGSRTTGMHWHLHKTGERHYRAYRKLGKRMPVSVCLGGDPAYTYAATAPMPDNMDEYMLAGFLRRKPVRLVRCLTNDLYVPADCDFVIEGYVDPTQAKFTEGPFGDHTGFYSLEDLYPEFHVTAVTHRRDAVYPATVVGIPPQEDAYIAAATEKIFLEPIRAVMQPEVEDMYMPPAGVAHNLAIVSIEKTYAGQARKVAAAMWGAGQMMFNKILVVVPSGVNIRSEDALSRLVRSMDPPRDIMISSGVLDVLDHVAGAAGEGGKMAIDLTAGRDAVEVAAPDHLPAPNWAHAVDTRFLGRWGTLVVYVCPPGIAGAQHPGHDDAGTVADAQVRSMDDLTVLIGDYLSDKGLTGLKAVVVTDPGASGFGGRELLWFAAANTDPQRDTRIVSGTLTVDARTKTGLCPGYPRRVPNVVAASQDTVRMVDRKWDSYGIGPFVGSPSERYRAVIYGRGAEVGED